MSTPCLPLIFARSLESSSNKTLSRHHLISRFASFASREKRKIGFWNYQNRQYINKHLQFHHVGQYVQLNFTQEQLNIIDQVIGMRSERSGWLMRVRGRQKKNRVNSRAKKKWYRVVCTCVLYPPIFLFIMHHAFC